MLQMIEQLAQATQPVSHAKELYGIAAIFATQIGLAFVAHIKGRKRPVETTKQMNLALNNALTPVSIKLDSLSNDVQDLRAHVIGPDGQNGLRSEVREIKSDVRGILERERLHGTYDRRAV